MTLKTHPERRAEMLAALVKRLEAYRHMMGSTYPLDVVERELILEALQKQKQKQKQE